MKFENLINQYNKNIIYVTPKIIGVTGTVGKTTTVELLYQYLTQWNHRVYCITTSGIKCNTNLRYNTNDLQSTCFHSTELLLKHLKNAYDEKCDYILIEVTAETAVEGIFDDIEFDLLALNYFKYGVVQSFDNDQDYLNAKLKLFISPNIKKVLINSNCEEFKKAVLSKRVDNVFGFGDPNNDRCYYQDFRVDEKGFIEAIFSLDPHDVYKTNLLTSINKDNLLCFYSIIGELGEYDPSPLHFVLKRTEIRGRYNSFDLYGREIVIDTGYNGIDGMDPFVKESKSKRTIIVTSVYNFENTEKNERPQVVQYRKDKGAYLDQHFDEIIITSTHRGELNHEDKNIDDIMSTCPRAIKISNRFSALKKAWNMSKAGDRIFITGKGTEADIYIGRLPLDDEDMITIIAECENC